MFTCSYMFICCKSHNTGLKLVRPNSRDGHGSGLTPGLGVVLKFLRWDSQKYCSNYFFSDFYIFVWAPLQGKPLIIFMMGYSLPSPLCPSPPNSLISKTGNKGLVMSKFNSWIICGPCKEIGSRKIGSSAWNINTPLTDSCVAQCRL